MKKFLLLVKQIDIKTLVTGDKSARIILESLDPNDIDEISKLANLMEVEVSFEQRNSARNGTENSD